MAKTDSKRAKGSGCLVKRGDIYMARWVKDGQVYTRTTGLSDKKKAKDKLAEFVAPFRMGDEAAVIETMTAKLGGVKAQIQRIEDAKPSTTIHDGWETYLKQATKPDSGEVTLAQYQSWYKAFVKWLTTAYPEATELRHVSQGIADEYCGHLSNQVAPTTYNRHVNALTLIWRVLNKIAKIAVNPWEEITRKKFVAHSRRELTVEELIRIIQAAQGEMKMLIAFGIYTGLRLGDCACIRWDNIDMVKHIISVIPAKTARRTKKRVTVPIHQMLFQLLDEIPNEKRRGFVLPTCEARYHQFNAALAKDVAKLFQSVGIQTQTEATETERGRPDAGFHSLRHTFVSLCAAGGVPQSVVQSLVGHGSPAMTAHYTHIGVDTARTAIAALPDVSGGGEPKESNASAEIELDAFLEKLEKLTKDDLKRLIKKAQEIEKTKNPL
jgi:integrase